MSNLVGRRWISVNSAAEYLALHPESIRDMINRKLIPAVHIGRAVRIDLKALDEILNAQLDQAGDRGRGRK